MTGGAPRVPGQETDNGMTQGISPATTLDDGIVATAESCLAAVGQAREAIHGVIFGQEKVVDLALVTILAGGHGLLVGVPGLAKTKLVETLGTVLGLDARRVQFTPDLMPSDILGTEILEEDADRRRAFRFVQGPVFTQLLMADEINRASPRTQSALLQAMQEDHVSVAGDRHDLPRPVPRARDAEPDRAGGHLSAARGAARPLPAGDRRRLSRPRRRAPHPDRDHRRRRGAPARRDVHRAVAHRPAPRAPAAGRRGRGRGDPRPRARRPARTAATPLVKDKLLWGPGPRASQALTLAARARALIEGRVAPSVADVKALAEPVLKHRMALSYAARADGETIEGLIAQARGEASADYGRRRQRRSTARHGARPAGARARARPALSRSAMPRLVLEARRVSSLLAHGLHGRRRAGPGESFWQFRPFVTGEAAARIDWRRSARDDRLYVREREWEAAHTIWLWIDRSASMGFASDLASGVRRSSARWSSGSRSPTPSWRAASGSACSG